MKVYQFGLMDPVQNASIVVEQMRAAHRYRNDLIAIERGRRAAERTLLEEHRGLQWLTWAWRDADQDCERLAGAIKTERATTRSRSDSARMRADLADAKARRRETAKTLAFGRALVRACSDMTALYERANDLRKSARAHCGVYWGTYLLAEQAAEAAAAMPLYDGASPNDPRFARWVGDGAVSVQLQGGLAVPLALNGQDTRVRIAMAGHSKGGRRQFARLFLRIATDAERAPIWAEWPMVLHRPLPADGRIKVATVSRRGDGRSRPRWTVEFTVEETAPEPRTGGAVGVDLGWRLIGNQIRVAYWAGDDGARGEVLLPERMMAGFAKVDSLRSIRDRNFNAARDAFAQALEAHVEAPEWLRVEARTVAQWRSPGRLAAMCRRGRADGSTRDLFAELEAWRYHDHHLWRWEGDMRRTLLEERRHLYRNAAATLARAYATVCLERFDLRAVARTPGVEAEKAENEAARRNRTIAATSILRDAIRSRFRGDGGTVVEIAAERTTRGAGACSECGGRIDGDAAATLRLMCERGHVIDQDMNAATNILRRGCERLSDGVSSAPARMGNDAKREGRWARAKREKRERLERDEAAREATAKTANAHGV